MRGTPGGDVYFGVVFPDPQTAARESNHWAVNNGRVRTEGDKQYAEPYPDHLFSSVLAIERTLVGLGEYSRADIYALYDSENIELFFALRKAAFEVLGLSEMTESNAGQGAWQTAFTLVRNALMAHREGREGLLKETLYAIQRQAGTALEEFGVKPEYIEDESEPKDHDPVMEAMKEDPTQAHSQA